MNEEEFLAFCSLKDTQVTFLESGHDPISDESPAQEFAKKLHEQREQQESGNGSRVFMALGGPTISQLSYSLKYVIHAQGIGYDSVKPIIVGTPPSARKCKAYIDRGLTLVDKFDSFGDFEKLRHILDEYINISMALSLRAIDENNPLTEEPVRQERDEFLEQSLDDILNATESDEQLLARKVRHKDMTPEDVRAKITRRNELVHELKKYDDKLDKGLSLGMYAALCNSIEEIIKIMNKSKDHWTLERYKALLRSMKDHVYSFDDAEKLQDILAHATSIYAGGGRPDYAKRNLGNLGGVEWLRSIVIDNKVTWQGYSMGCDMALDNMDLLCRGSCSTNKRGKMVVDDCVFIPFGNGLGLFNKITVVVHGETYLPDSDCTDLPPKDALNRIVVPELRKKGETFVYINNATIVKAENNGRREYRAFVGTNSAILFYHRGEFLQEFGPGQTQLNVKALNKERDRVEELRKSA